ncbi:hypothetical protein DSCA_58890 [Desulfosarcina alkanivorans]|uniref:Uncharacterized protein n=1 Tax=Desulfosarcina alkanivorans TaxID=571177 RepID=A0A5K7YVA1_9BACT|nr:hypothetical protein [Desulfosarcina alkanivorans]BBO71959.1 hypothetical protein DSCA_58890 [Desulfosarcina alkanivorans]
MDSDLALSGKYTFRAGGRKLVVVKRPVERFRHVVMKALLWALFLPSYPHLRVEVPIGCKYKPDLVQTGPQGPEFWAEAGHIGTQKLRCMLRRFPRTHFALAVWGGSFAPLESRIHHQTSPMRRSAPIDLIAFPEDADTHFIDGRGWIRITLDDLNRRRLQ